MNKLPQNKINFCVEAPDNSHSQRTAKISNTVARLGDNKLHKNTVVNLNSHFMVEAL